MTSKLILIITVATNYVEGKTGSDTCTVGSAITDTHECKEACNELNRPVGTLSEGNLCYVAGNGRCKQDGSMNPKGRLVCKMLGNMIIHKTYYCLVFFHSLLRSTNFEILWFTVYTKKRGNYCSPVSQQMRSTNVIDAKKECLNKPKCDMFYDVDAIGKEFWACENTASIEMSSYGSILYKREGNNTYGHL